MSPLSEMSSRFFRRVSCDMFLCDIAIAWFEQIRKRRTNDSSYCISSGLEFDVGYVGYDSPCLTDDSLIIIQWAYI